MCNKKELKTAFTLVELLVVISIIALLLAILMPSLSRARELAKRTVCKSNLGNARYAIDMYSMSNRELVMPASTTVPDPSNGSPFMKGWMDLISGYIAQKDNSILYTTAPKVPKNTLIVCPSNILMRTDTTIYAAGYAMNARRGMALGPFYGSYSLVDQGIKQAAIKNPSQKIVLSDARQNLPGRDGNPPSQRYKTIYWWTLGVAQYKSCDYFVGRGIHKEDGANFLWSDGHVSSDKFKDWNADPSIGWWAILNHN